MYGQDRDANRRLFVSAWKKHRDGQPLEPLERVIIDIIALHPEYHRVVEDEERALAADYAPAGGATNPFLHMGMHIAIHEPVANRKFLCREF